MALTDLRVSNHGCQAGAQASAAHQFAGFCHQSLADKNVVAALPVSDRGAGVVWIDTPRQPDHRVGDLFDRLPAGGNLMRQRAVGRGPLFHQRSDALRAVGGRQQGAVGGHQQPLGNFVRAGSQADDHTAAAHQLAIARRNQRAAAGRDDYTVLLRQFQAQLGLHGAKSRLAILGEDRADLLAGLALDHLIHVDEDAPQPLGYGFADHGLAGAHESGENDVLVGHN